MAVGSESLTLVGQWWRVHDRGFESLILGVNGCE
jgi:hypothetical protein